MSMGSAFRHRLDDARHILRVNYARGGAGAVARHLADKVRNRVYLRRHLYVIAQELASIADVPPPAGVRIAPFTGPDWTAIKPFTTWAELARYQRAAAAGRHCLVAWRGDRAVGYTWLSESMDPDIERVPLILPLGSAYGWNLFVPVEERSRGIGSALLTARHLLARHLGYRTVVRVIETTNTPSLRTVAKTAGDGTTIVGMLTLTRLLDWRHWREVPEHDTLDRVLAPPT